MSKINIEFRWNEFGSNYLMLGLTHGTRLQELWNSIDPDDLYEKDDPTKGIVREPHVSIIGDIDSSYPFKNFCHLLPNVGFNVPCKGLSIFEKDEYDVLKLDVRCVEVNETYARLIDRIPNENKYPEFNPHITVAYLKKGTAWRYINPEFDLNFYAKDWIYSKKLVSIHYRPLDK